MSFNEREKKRRTAGIVTSIINNEISESDTAKKDKAVLIKNESIEEKNTSYIDHEPVEQTLQFSLTLGRQEKRTERINFTVYPSVYKKVQEKCKQQNISVNELVNQLFMQFVK